MDASKNFPEIDERGGGVPNRRGRRGRRGHLDTCMALPIVEALYSGASYLFIASNRAVDYFTLSVWLKKTCNAEIASKRL